MYHAHKLVLHCVVVICSFFVIQLCNALINMYPHPPSRDYVGQQWGIYLSFDNALVPRGGVFDSRTNACYVSPTIVSAQYSRLLVTVL